MIQKTSSSDSAGGPDPVSITLSKPAVRALPPQEDSVSTANINGLRAALASQPEIRPDVVARGQALAADPNYPSMDVIQHVAGMILNAPDPSEDQS